MIAASIYLPSTSSSKTAASSIQDKVPEFFEDHLQRMHVCIGHRIRAEPIEPDGPPRSLPLRTVIALDRCGRLVRSFLHSVHLLNQTANGWQGHHLL